MPLKFFPTQRTYNSRNRSIRIGNLLLMAMLLILSTGCDSLPLGGSSNSTPVAEPQTKSINVDAALAKKGSLAAEIQYVGTTYPVRKVSLQSQVAGQILDVLADVGDRVQTGQVLARIDDSINNQTVLEEKAELEALRSEVTSLQADVNQGLTGIEQAQITLKQAQSDLTRSKQLANEGAITQQAAEQAQNTFDNAQQALRAAQQQVANRTSAVAAAQRRVAAQQALVAQEEARARFAVLRSPVTGSVLEREFEPGDLAQVGSEVFQLGDFSQIKIRVQISELALAKIRLGQATQVELDALPERTFRGQVTQISLAADEIARIVPIEITIPNQERQIGSGLLARVTFDPATDKHVVVPETAIQLAKAEEITTDTATVFVIQQQEQQATVQARQVQLGDRGNSRIEIISGLEPGEQYVVRSSSDLQDADQVNLSFLSESESSES